MNILADWLNVNQSSAVKDASPRYRDEKVILILKHNILKIIDATSFQKVRIGGQDKNMSMIIQDLSSFPPATKLGTSLLGLPIVLSLSLSSLYSVI